MTFIDDLLGNLFSDRQKKLAYKENFTPTEEEVFDNARWVESDKGQEVLDLVYSNYHLKRAGVNKEPEVHVLTSPYANGFAISYQKPFSRYIFRQIFFAFSQRLLDLGYQRVSLDRKMEEMSEQVKITEKSYFKPPFSIPSSSQKINQLFGNVSIEKVSLDNEPNFLKVLVTVYSDHQYLPAQPFDQFVERLFNR